MFINAVKTVKVHMYTFHLQKYTFLYVSQTHTDVFNTNLTI